ncbi:Acylphosphatase-1 [Orchesella cincta]|uniref:Acylphosphatase n=1 Tax=Orchesella cincta TaxID=48709 RepID=A0A1D2NKK2_ORCCI|nr:Acylphosphatase-1 [Orchesella cincta]
MNQQKRLVCVIIVVSVVAFTYLRATADDSEESEESEENLPVPTTRMSGSQELVYVDFEVFGSVQGVFFRKYTQAQGNKLGLRGFCRNTSAGTVSGSMEGPRPEIEQMKHWLQNTGSPMSRISRAVFKNEKVIEAYSFPKVFDIARTV